MNSESFFCDRVILNGSEVFCKTNDMRGVPYIMPPNFFNGNYNRYREHNNTVK
jgi:hypothetical protein